MTDQHALDLQKCLDFAAKKAEPPADELNKDVVSMPPEVEQALKVADVILALPEETVNAECARNALSTISSWVSHCSDLIADFIDGSRDTPPDDALRVVAELLRHLSAMGGRRPGDAVQGIGDSREWLCRLALLHAIDSRHVGLTMTFLSTLAEAAVDSLENALLHSGHALIEQEQALETGMLASLAYLQERVLPSLLRTHEISPHELPPFPNVRGLGGAEQLSAAISWWRIAKDASNAYADDILTAPTLETPDWHAECIELGSRISEWLSDWVSSQDPDLVHYLLEGFAGRLTTWCPLASELLRRGPRSAEVFEDETPASDYQQVVESTLRLLRMQDQLIAEPSIEDLLDEAQSPGFRLASAILCMRRGEHLVLRDPRSWAAIGQAIARINELEASVTEIDLCRVRTGTNEYPDREIARLTRSSVINGLLPRLNHVHEFKLLSMRDYPRAEPNRNTRLSDFLHEERSWWLELRSRALRLPAEVRSTETTIDPDVDSEKHLHKAIDDPPLNRIAVELSTTTICFEGIKRTVTTVKGLMYIAALIDGANSAFDARDLIRIVDAPARRSGSVRYSSNADHLDAKLTETGASGNPVLDKIAQEDLKRRLKELSDEIDLKGGPNSERAAPFIEEASQIRETLSGARSVTGRDRNLLSQPRRDHDSVSRAISRARNGQGKQPGLNTDHPEFNAHLDDSLIVRAGEIAYRYEGPPWMISAPFL